LSAREADRKTRGYGWRVWTVLHWSGPTLTRVRRLLRWLVAGLLLPLLVPAAATAAGSNDPLRSHQWGLDMIHADEAHAVTTGAGAVVAVVDTGVDAAHTDLQGRLLAGHDFVDNDGTPQDGNGHGTHVAGIVAADANNGVGVDSVAPGAKVLPVRVLDDNGSGTSSAVAAGIDWATSHGADVINLSLSGQLPLGGLVGETDMDAAIGRALDRGVIVVAAAGNDSLPLCENNSAQGRVLCVGAVDRRGGRSFYSSFGQGLGLVAPGGSSLPGSDEDVLSTWNDGQYDYLAGTSQATPHVSGVAALLVSLGVHGQAAVQRILATATDAGPPGPDAQFGAGIVNAAAAAVSGLGRSGAGQGGSSGAGVTGSARVKLRRAQRIRSVLRNGIRISCSAAGAGRCEATVSARGKTLARGGTAVAIGHTAVLVARPTRAGRRVLRAALKNRRGLTTTVTITVPGAKLKRKLRLAP
jgi:subtilisin family serine protease